VKAADATRGACGLQPDCFDTVEADGNAIRRGGVDPERLLETPATTN
jgi:hypothetical protein